MSDLKYHYQFGDGDNVDVYNIFINYSLDTHSIPVKCGIANLSKMTNVHTIKKCALFIFSILYT